MVDLDKFVKQKDFLICVDSDGCAMDTMDIKHFRCFGPCMVTEWGLEQWQDEILTRWNEVNLYTMTRGINRFLGLATALAEVNEKYCKVDGIQKYVAWAESAKELSNSAVNEMFQQTKHPIFEKALNWSMEVNRGIDQLDDSEKNPFPGAKEGLSVAHISADVAVVSSANKEAVLEEWERCGLTEAVDVLCCQDAGTKAACIEQLKAKGYASDHILMVGDAVGDMKAAESNGVFYYPILVRHEAESWKEFTEVALAKFTEKDYAEYGQEKRIAFETNLR